MYCTGTEGYFARRYFRVLLAFDLIAGDGGESERRDGVVELGSRALLTVI